MHMLSPEQEKEKTEARQSNSCKTAYYYVSWGISSLYSNLSIRIARRLALVRIG